MYGRSFNFYIFALSLSTKVEKPKNISFATEWQTFVKPLSNFYSFSKSMFYLLEFYVVLLNKLLTFNKGFQG